VHNPSTLSRLNQNQYMELHRIKNRFGLRRGLALGVCLSLLTACASDDAAVADRPASLDQTPPSSGFLSESAYARLRPSPLHKGARVYENPRLAQYRSFIVDSVKVIPDRTARGRPLTPVDSVNLGVKARFAVIDALKINYTIVDKPGKGVARMRLAVTKVAFSGTTPAGVMELGGAAGEVEIVDSLTGELLGAATEADVVSPSQSAAESIDKLADAELVFDHWAARLNLWLQRLARGERTYGTK